MKTIKIIDFLNEIANGEEVPKKVRYNDEIKKILNNFKKHLKENYKDYLNGAVNSTEYYISCGDIKILLDYITNLQEENQRLKKEKIKLYKKDTKIINELKEELEITHEKWNKDKQWSECRTKEWLDYKSRIDKAIEYINENGGFIFNEYEEIISNEVVDVESILEILEGKSNE